MTDIQSRALMLAERMMRDYRDETARFGIEPSLHVRHPLVLLVELACTSIEFEETGWRSDVAKKEQLWVLWVLADEAIRRMR